MKRLITSALAFSLALVFLLPTGALALTGQSYKTFDEYYKADVTFINDNDSRHLMPMLLSQRSSGKNDGQVFYDLIGDVLNVTVTVDSNGVIEECEIRLTAPANMAYGSSEYNDFTISGYHSYAFLMAMDPNTEPAKRYELVPDVVQGMKDGNGSYTRPMGAYTLTCTRIDQMAVLNFMNNGVVVDTTPSRHQAPRFPGRNACDRYARCAGRCAKRTAGIHHDFRWVNRKAYARLTRQNLRVTVRNRMLPKFNQRKTGDRVEPNPQPCRLFCKQCQAGRHSIQIRLIAGTSLQPDLPDCLPPCPSPWA